MPQFLSSLGRQQHGRQIAGIIMTSGPQFGRSPIQCGHVLQGNKYIQAVTRLVFVQGHVPAVSMPSLRRGTGRGNHKGEIGNLDIFPG